MIHIKYPDVKKFFNIFDSLTGLFDSFNFCISKDAVYIKQMDSTHTCYVDLAIYKEDFEMYQISVDNQEYGLLLKHFVNILGSCKDAECIIIYVNNTVFNLEFRYKNYVKKFELNTINIDTVQLDIPGCDYQCEMKLASVKYCNLIDTVGIMESNFIDFHLFNDELVISGIGDIGKFKQSYLKNASVKQNQTLKIKTNDGNVILNKIFNPEFYSLCCSNNNFQNSYSFKLMSLFKKSSRLSTSMLISMNPDQPLKIDIIINDNTGSNLSFHLAPKIE